MCRIFQGFKGHSVKILPFILGREREREKGRKGGVLGPVSLKMKCERQRKDVNV